VNVKANEVVGGGCLLLISTVFAAIGAALLVRLGEWLLALLGHLAISIH